MDSNRQQPEHPNVDWLRTRFGPDGPEVPITCPDCGAERYQLARNIRYRVHLGKFDGRCKSDARRVASLRRAADHPAVEAEPSSASSVLVTCPMCNRSRRVSAASVRKQQREGVFTGLCREDRLVGKARNTTRPSHPAVDWNDIEVVRESGKAQSRRAMIRVACPSCGEITLFNPSYLARLINSDNFRPECKAHRAPRGQSLRRN